MKDRTKIGTVTFNFDENGTLKDTTFVSEMKIDAKFSINLTDVPNTNLESTIKDESEKVLANYFSQMNEIELGDRTQYKLVSDIILCEKYESGKVRLCKVEFTYQKLADVTVN